MYDVVIIGAGVVGAMTARTLAKYNLKICILDKMNDVAMGATRANSAIVHAGFDAREGSMKAKLNVQGSKMMEKVAKELGVKYQKNGSLVIGFTQEDRATVEALCERGRKNGVEGVRVLEKDELQTLEPNISDSAICALYAPTGAIICPYELTIAAVGNAMDNGADLKLNFEVKDIQKQAGGFVISSDTEQVEARYVINAAGVYADHIAAMVGDTSFHITPRRGEYILLDKECGDVVSHTIFRTPTKMGKGILITPTVDGNLLTGPTSENITDKDNIGTTAEGLSRVMSAAAENLKSINYGKSITSFCGLRAVGSTGDFILNSPVPGFINAAGIESPGLSSAPAIAEYIVELLKEQGCTPEEKADFNPLRKPAHWFFQATVEEKNAVIRENPAYGRVICRCETITEGEILEAIRNNPGARDVDGVKRRTRAGMGRCQGGFCASYVMELLSEELHIPYEQITKFGGDSYLLTGRTKEVQ